MDRTRGFSPTLLVVGILAVAGGSAAGLLGVGAPTNAPIGSTSSASASTGLAVDLILIIPVAVLVGVVVISLLRTGGTAVGRRGGITAVLSIAVVLLALVWVLHLPGSGIGAIVGGITGTGGDGGSGTGAGGHGGNGSGGTGTGSGGNGSGGFGGGNGTSNGSSNGTGGSGHGSNGTNGTGNGTGNGTKNGTGGSGSGNNSTGGGGGNHTGGGGSGGSGSGGQNHTATGAAPDYPQTASTWPVYVAAAGGSIVLGAIVLPVVSARLARRVPRPAPALEDARASAARAFADAARRLQGATDAQAVIVQLYSELMARLESHVQIALYQTPEEIRQFHLVPLGVRVEVAEQLTRLF